MVCETGQFESTNTEALLVLIKEEEFFTFNLIFKLMFTRQNCYTEMTNLLQFIINVRKSHRQPQFTLQLVYEDLVLFD